MQPETGKFKQSLQQITNQKSRTIRAACGFSSLVRHDQNLVVAPLNSFFAALSYVWGDCNNSTKQTQGVPWKRGTFDEPGALTSREVPNTINGAIEVCVRLDIPYLWVDRPCILQDEEEDVQQQVQSMDDVFPSAYVVLVALVSNMDSGIPGITSPPQLKEVHFDGLQIVQNILTDPNQLAIERNKSPWTTRGWTYQEGVLSRKLLYLSNGHVWYADGHLQRFFWDIQCDIWSRFFVLRFAEG
ncbi:heterokaryon incompatibility protein-domain-containing protein [Phyllosticta citrichinensis]